MGRFGHTESEEKFSAYDFRDLDDSVDNSMESELSANYKDDHWRLVEDHGNSEKLQKFPLDWGKYGLAFFRALEMPSSIGQNMFMAVCLRYMKFRPTLLRDKLREADIPRDVVSPFIDYLYGNLARLEELFDEYGQLTMVDKYFRTEHDSKRRLSKIIIPENVKDFYDFRAWYDSNHRSRRVDAPCGAKFNAYLDIAFQENLAALDDTSSGKSEEEREADFYQAEERLHRLQIKNQCQTSTAGAEWGANRAHAPLADHIAEYLNWHSHANFKFEDYEWNDLSNEFREIRPTNYTLEENMLNGAVHHDKTLHILTPFENGREAYMRDYAYERHFEERRYKFRREDMEKMTARFLGGLDTTCVQRPGGFVNDEDGSLQVRFGIHRNARPDEITIAKGCYLFDETAEVPMEGSIPWRAMYPKPEFYTECLGPHFVTDTTSDPFEWALKRCKVAAGYATSLGIGRDYPLGHFQQQFMKMANIVCNATPEETTVPRVFHMTDEKKALLRKAQEVLGEAYCPETAWLILENEDIVGEESLQDPEFLELLGKIPACLEKGLVMDRLQEFYEANSKHDLDPLEALKFAMKIVADIYTSGEEPWWFKENFDISEVFDAKGDECVITDGTLQVGYCEEGRSLVADVAHEAGFGFTYAMDLYKKAGHKLVAVQGLNSKEAFGFSCEIAKKYGIGNLQRATSIVEFAIHHVNEVASNKRPESFELFKEFAKLSAPYSTIVSAMEGGETTLSIPGFSGLMLTCVGEERMKELKMDDEVITPAILKEVAVPLSVPLRERARLIPGVLKHRLFQSEQKKLLAASADAGRLMLPMPKDQSLEVSDGGSENPFETPSNSIFSFFKQVKTECGCLNDKIIRIYFALYATKFPNPFRPPKGFLTFLQKFQNVPNPQAQKAMNDRLFGTNPFSHNAGGLRRAAGEREAKASINRDLIISNILDAQIMGLLTWAEVEGIFEWMVGDLSPEKIAELELESREETKEGEKWRKKRLRERKRERREWAKKEAAGTLTWEEKDRRRRDDRDDSDLAALTPEQIEARIAEKVHEKARDASGQIHLKRILIAEDGIDFIAAVNILVVLKLVTPEDFRQLVSEHLRMMPVMEEYYPLLTHEDAVFPLLNKDVFKETIEILKTLSEWGVIDFDAFRAGVASESPLEQKYSLLREFFFCVGAYRRSQAVIEEYKDEMHSNMRRLSHAKNSRRGGYMYDSYGYPDMSKVVEEGSDIVLRMEVALQKTWGLTPLIARTVMEKMVTETIATLFTKEDYPEVYESMAKLGELGVYDVDTFAAAFSEQTPATTRYRLLQQIFLCAGAYVRTNERIKDFDREFYRKSLPAPQRFGHDEEQPNASAPPAPEPTLGEREFKLFAELERDVRQYWQGISCVSPGTANIFLQDSLNSAKYFSIFRIVHDTKIGAQNAQNPEEAEGETTDSKEHASLRRNVQALSTASFRTMSSLFAARMLKVGQELEAPESRAQALLTDGQILEVPVVSNEIELHRFQEYDEKSVETLVADNEDRITSSLKMYRKDCLGYVSIGGKLHVSNWNPERLQALKDLMGLSSTQFHLQYMDDVLLLPASLSGSELKAFILMLVKAGIVTPDNLQLQVGIPGRLSPENAAYLGSAVLLSTEKGFRYSEDSFCTNQDHATGARLMLYDANGPSTKLPFMTELIGRTDMLGRMHLNDIDLYQLIGTALVHAQFGGPFENFGKEYKQRYEAILKKHGNGLESVLKEKWIYKQNDDRKDDGASKSHHETVKKVTDAYFDCADKSDQTGVQEGIIFEVRALNDWLKESIKGVQEKLYHDKSTCKEADLAVNF
jgi:hypothetical protein